MAMAWGMIMGARGMKCRLAMFLATVMMNMIVICMHMISRVLGPIWLPAQSALIEGALQLAGRL